VLQIVLMGAAAGIVFGVFTLMLELAGLMIQVSNRTEAGLGAASVTSWAPISALVGFVLGALWQYRRSA
jgi:hypothetical protein